MTMKSKIPQPTFLVPRAVGRSEADMIAGGHAEQLHLFRKTMTEPTKQLFIAMLALFDQKNIDQTQYARVADILRAMGYEPKVRNDGFRFIVCYLASASSSFSYAIAHCVKRIEPVLIRGEMSLIWQKVCVVSDNMATLATDFH
jgi:hypothetical protein